MKATGMVRVIDDMGRLVIPAEIRKNLGLKVRDSVEFYSTDEGLVLKKYAPACIFCNSTEDMILYNDKYICKNCRKKLNTDEA